MNIDPLISASEIVSMWKVGDLRVIDILENDHPALTALVITVGIHERLLSVSDVNMITNLLLDRRIAMAQRGEVVNNENL